MSEDSKDSAPAAPTPARTIEAPITSFVRGGTITSAYERDLYRKKVDADRRRKEDDARHTIAKNDPQGARMSTTKLGGTKSHAAIVLEIRNSDGKAEEFITCELLVNDQDPTELTLNMCCPYCAQKYGSGEAQFKFSNKHKRFELDRRRAGELWVNPNQPSEFVYLAGTIHLTEAVQCPGLGCSWRFKIDNSVVRPL